MAGKSENIEKLDSKVVLNLNGEDKILEYNMHSAAQYQRLTGKNLLKGNVDSQEPQDIIAILWAGLITNQEDLDGAFIEGKPDERVEMGIRLVGKWIRFDEIERISAAIGKAFNGSVDSTEKGKAGNVEAPAPAK